MDFAGLVISVVAADPGLIIKYQIRNVLVVPVLMPLCQHAAAAESVLGIYLDVLSDTQLLLKVFGRLYDIRVMFDISLSECPRRGNREMN